MISNSHKTLRMLQDHYPLIPCQLFFLPVQLEIFTVRNLIYANCTACQRSDFSTPVTRCPFKWFQFQPFSWTFYFAGDDFNDHTIEKIATHPCFFRKRITDG